jgi:MFS family permease
LLCGNVLNKVTGFLQVFLAFYLTRRGFSAPQVGLALSALAAGGIIGTVSAGSLTDRFSSRSLIAASLAASGALTASLAFATRPAVIMALLALGGATSQASRPAVSSLLAGLTPDEHRVMIFALYRLSFNLGLTIAPLLGAVLATRTSFSWLLVGDGATAMVFALVVLALLPDARPDHRPAAAGAAAAVPTVSYRGVLQDRRYRWFLAALFLSAVVYVQHVSTLPLQLVHNGSGAGVFGVLVAINAFLVLVAELPVTRIVQRWAPGLAVGIGFALVALGLTLYAGPSAFGWLVLATVVWSTGEIVATPTAMAHPTRAASPELVGRYVGLAEGVQTLGYALGPVLGTAAFAWLGRGVWWACGITGAVAALSVVRGIAGGARRHSPPAPALVPALVAS